MVVVKNYMVAKKQDYIWQRKRDIYDEELSFAFHLCLCCWFLLLFVYLFILK
jgi:hypothetical protein